ncbi:Uncharacterised protein [BD1-7 clade bacterium]|uniref:Heme-binding protein n=1 Tax=BD1-7 clade bacterium TaxID=2029982 RepID=A0A5S9QCE5_9GAMM|nr:Uncharacterised protein [BD1-7 clade bacterium]CAA0115587.1 Uncharacterised protein [BD1-7 clade bacterium]
MDIINRPQIGYRSALALVDAALTIAEEMGIQICACVVDISGRVVAQATMNNAPHIAEELCLRKARTALLGLSSAQFAEAVGSTGSIAQSMLHADLTLLGGGLPILAENVNVGAFAVGGATVDQDVECASRALAQLLGE